MSLRLPPVMTRPAVQAIFAALEAKGGEGCVRFVGGCVRNVLMGRAPSDLDLATQLTPDETEAALAAAGIRSVPTGKAFGTISAIIDSEAFEITSLREDVETDGRRAVVRFTTNWAKDAQRRDFYLNALYADIRGDVFDPTGEGLGDAEAGRVRFIGEAETRIREDYLRILRFFRFTIDYGYDLDAASFAACVRLQDGIERLSGERIQQELMKLLAVPSAIMVIRVMISEGIMARMLGGVTLEATRQVLSGVAALSRDPEARFLALLTPDALTDEAISTIASRLKLSNALTQRLRAVASWFDQVDLAALEAVWRAQIYAAGRTTIEDALRLKAGHADMSARDWDGLSIRLDRIEVPVFPLKSAQLVEAGLKAGPELGQAMKRIEADWAAHDFSQSVIDTAIDEIRERTKI